MSEIILPDGESHEVSEPAEEKLTEWEMEKRKQHAFMDRLSEFLLNDPYWMYILASGNHADRKRLGQMIGKAVTRVPTLQSAPVPNRATRRAIIKEARKRAARGD